MRKAIENWFEKSGYVIFRHRYTAVILMFALTMVLGFQMLNIVMDTSYESMVKVDDPERITYNEFRDQFGGDQIIVVAVKTQEIFNIDFLKKLQSLHNDIEEQVPYLEEINSLINARNTYGKDDTLVVEDLIGDRLDLEQATEQTIDLVKIKSIALKNPAYLNNYISEDSKTTAIIIKLQGIIVEENDAVIEDEFLFDEGRGRETHYLGEKENNMVFHALQKIADHYNKSDFKIAITGAPYVEETMNFTVKKAALQLVLVSYLLMSVILALFFRRVAGVILPMVIALMSISSILGCMAVFNIPFTQCSLCLPTFLIAISTADAIHILTIFFRGYNKGESKEEAIAHALAHSGLPVVLTTLTTAAGFLSFAYSELRTIGELGIFSAGGVLFALLYTLVMLPGLIAIFPIKKFETGPEKKACLLDNILISIGNFATGHPIKIIIVCTIVFITFSVFMFKLRFFVNIVNQFPDNSTIKNDTLFIDKELKGGLAVEVIVDTNKENGLYEPTIVNKIERLSTYMEAYQTPDIFVGKVFSINDIIKETNRALHNNNEAYYKIPQNRDLIAQELLLFENTGAEDLEKIVDSQFSKTRVTLKIPYVDIFEIGTLTTHIKDKFQEAFQEKATITVTGIGRLMGTVMPKAIYSMSRSYVIAFSIITIIMILLVGNVKIGTICMAPNLLPILMVMGFMGMTGLPLDLNAMLIGAVAIGLVVDDTMHFVYNFRKYHDRFGTSRKAVEETLLGTGRALLITTIALSTNFLSTGLCGKLSTVVMFGVCTGLVIILALATDFTLLPALLTVIKRREQNHVKAL